MIRDECNVKSDLQENQDRLFWVCLFLVLFGFAYFFFFFFTSPRVYMGGSEEAIPCCQTSSALGIGDGLLKTPRDPKVGKCSKTVTCIVLIGLRHCRLCLPISLKMINVYDI